MMHPSSLPEQHDEQGSNWRRPAVWAAIGVLVTVVLAVGVVIVLLWFGGDAKAVSNNAPLIAAVIALGGVFTAQMVSIALEDQRTRETRKIEVARTTENRRIEDKRTEDAREIEEQRVQE